jgi:hypothetical protein
VGRARHPSSSDIQKGLDKLKEANDNLTNAKGGKEIEKAKKALAEATKEGRDHIKAIQDLGRNIAKTAPSR